MNKSSNLANSDNRPLSSSATRPTSGHEPQKVKMVLLGDAEVGKSSLVVTFTTRSFPKPNQPAKNGKAGPFADYYSTMTLDDKDFELSVWDTNASAEYEHIRPLNFAKTDIFLLCFSVVEGVTLENIAKWSREIRNNFPAGKEPPKLLVGLKTDLRYEPMLYDKQKRATREQALQVAKEIGASDYVECSARCGDGVEEVFLAALNSVVYPCHIQPADNVNLRGSGGANVEEDVKDLLSLPNAGAAQRGKKKRCIIC